MDGNDMASGQLPFLSIVIASLNHGKFLEEAICSVLTQSCQDFELIVVDGGSNDQSLDIIKRYQKKLGWWCSEPDSGQSEAFNKGFSVAKGKLLTWLNADDIMLPNTIMKAKCLALSHPKAKWITGNFLRFQEDDTVVQSKWGPHFIPPFLQRPNAPCTAYGPTSFFARDVFFEVGGMDETFHYTMDTDLWQRFLRFGLRQHRLNHYCWAFRMHEGSKTAYAMEPSRHKDRARLFNERRRSRDKNSYHLSKSIHFATLGFRILDGSILLSLRNQILGHGKPWKEFIGCRGLDAEWIARCRERFGE